MAQHRFHLCELWLAQQAYNVPSCARRRLVCRAPGNVHMALENLIEQVDAIRPSGMSIVKAVELHVRITHAALSTPSAKAKLQNADGETARSAEAQIPSLPDPGNSASSLPELPPAQL